MTTSTDPRPLVRETVTVRRYDRLRYGVVAGGKEYVPGETVYDALWNYTGNAPHIIGAYRPYFKEDSQEIEVEFRKST